LFSFFAASLISCASQRNSVTIATGEPGSQISLVPMDNPDGLGTILPNPATLPAERLRGHALKIAAAGKAPSYWFAPSEAATRVLIRVRQLNSCGSQNDKNPNRPVRLLLKAYQALSANDYTLARDLAKKASEIDPTLAGPHIITGLTFYNEGKKQEARLSFNKARALDPEDQEIGQLLRMVE
jgi:hypothetical protein